MDDRMVIDTKYFSNTINELDSSITTYKNAREIIFKANGELFNSWDGYGGDTYKNEFIKLKTKITDQEDNLIEMCNILKDIYRQYKDYDFKLSKDI